MIWASRARGKSADCSERHGARAARCRADATASVLFHGLLSASIGSVLIGLTVAFFSWRTLRRATMGPLHAALRQFGAIAAGELTTRVAIRSNDEMATLLRGVASMQDKLRATVTSVRAG
ncbi:methyl-accepting chemotaxis protein [Paraburkholderia kirstenboschensis]|uniref:Methyl-accepting chemotaxis protein n=1 Tax=Paraburkholderia kirstenboschensis TaxID=1245436 RepID=A0ABZ0ESN7_9BURK|nr:methyl-accepting chemotaxis protein [Paraburkholderia kirstenboschensis]WOD20217.1 methyl-accepting chemotaxis protein [Paraburkholderia kirstenboschensis]